MKKAYHYIFYIVITLVFVAAGGLYFWRSQAVSIINKGAGLAEEIVPPEIVVAPDKNALDTTIFTAPKFLALKNNVIRFDFENICKTPVGRIESLATSSDGSLATSTQIINCLVGNSSPFPLPAKQE